MLEIRPSKEGVLLAAGNSEGVEGSRTYNRPLKVAWSMNSTAEY